jgi:hypothetical protein
VSSYGREERSAALKSFEILDTPPEPEFDDVVSLIAQICKVPRAAISLIDDDREWLKAESASGSRRCLSAAPSAQASSLSPV